MLTFFQRKDASNSCVIGKYLWNSSFADGTNMTQLTYGSEIGFKL